MRELILSIIILLTLTDSIAQVIVLEDGNQKYQNQVIFEDNDTTGLWEFKDNLPTGQYWVIEQTECGPDTLKYAEFITNGIKHGTWTRWESGLCFGTYKENSDEIERWAFASDKDKDYETMYDSGFIVKSTVFHIGSNQPHWEHFYPTRAKKENTWIEERIWTEEGTLRWTTNVHEDGSSTHKDFYPNGQLKAKGKFGKSGTHEGSWIYYYENGQLMGQGEFEPFNARFYAGWRVPKGYWQYWDEDGSIIAEVTFKKGKPRKVKRHQDKKIPFAKINEMMTKKQE